MYVNDMREMLHDELRNMRICENCECNKLCDEYHFSLECLALNGIQKNISKNIIERRF